MSHLLLERVVLSFMGSRPVSAAASTSQVLSPASSRDTKASVLTGKSSKAAPFLWTLPFFPFKVLLRLSPPPNLL